jgi:inner membrane protein involved in colicin E2 resistance
MKEKQSPEFQAFDRVIGGLLAVPYSELQAKLQEEKRSKERKKKRPTSTASSRASSSGKKRVA